MRPGRLGTSLASVLAVLLLAVPSAGAISPRVVAFPVGGSLGGLTAGPDGNVWFTMASNPGTIGYITHYGALTEFTGGTTPGFTANSYPVDITTGPDGRLWVAQYSYPGRVTAVTTAGTFTEMAVNGTTPGFGRQPYGIAAAQGSLWLTNSPSPGGVTRVTTGGAATQIATGGTTPGFNYNASPDKIVAGPDGNLWFDETAYYPSDPPGLVRLTPGGAITDFRPGNTPGMVGPVDDIAAGADGNVWFTAGASVIGRITPSGAVRTFLPGSSPGFSAGAAPRSITRGPDGAMWFTWDQWDPTRVWWDQYVPGGLSRINSAGEVMEFRWSSTSGMENARLGNLTTGGDNDIWYGVNGQLARFSTFFSQPAPTLATVSVVPRRFTLGSPREVAPAAKSRARRGTTIRFTLRRAGRVRLGFMTEERRHMGARRCMRGSKGSAGAKRCMRRVPMGSVEVRGHRGRNVVRFNGRTDQGLLYPGRFGVEVTVTDPATDMSTMKRARFRVVR